MIQFTKKYLKKKSFIFINFIVAGCVIASTSPAVSQHQFSQGSIIFFVSLSMPDEVLKAYLQQAASVHIPVVIRGLYSNPKHAHSNNALNSSVKIGSFEDTTKRVFQLLKGSMSKNKDFSSLSGGVSINPILFKKFSIQVVPALVVVSQQSTCLQKSVGTGNENCSVIDYDVVFGNVPLKTSLSLLAEKSTDQPRVFMLKRMLEKLIPQKNKQEKIS